MVDVAVPLVQGRRSRSQLRAMEVTCHQFVSRGYILADRTATQYDRLLASPCRLSVRLSVTLCIVALRVGVQG